MCGILGFNWENKILLNKGLKEMEHRGPDNFGVFYDKNLSLGHKRLSIIDISDSGKQPMSNEDETIWIVFNGEIYNFKELKQTLKKKHNFKSSTDTEILIHLYEEQGINFLNQLQGMFAFCIYDSKKKLLFLARDRAGKKPLYYLDKKPKFIFSSEIKAILKDESIIPEVNLNALPYFLCFRANTNQETFFRGIKKLNPGHFLIYNLKNNQSKISKYWDIDCEPEIKNKDYFVNKLKILLEDSVKSRLVSDVPYGAYLSGGIDSGTIVSLMKKYCSEPVKTFSVGFETEKHSETNEARFLAEKIGTEHHELLIKEDSVKKLPDIVYQADEPMSDPTSIPVYFLSEFAKKYCTVILTGEGADEIFAGYPQYKFMKMNNSIIKKFPNIITKKSPSLLKLTPKTFLDKSFKFASSLGEKGIDRFSNFINSNNLSEQYLNLVSIFNEEEQSELLNKKISLYKKYDSYFKNSDLKNLTRNCQILDFKEPLVEDLLMKLDKNTMAFSIEGRAPFLDYRIIELAFKIPDNLKLKGFLKDKFILREAVKGLIPEQTRKRKKRHFFVPIDNWFAGELSSFRNEVLSKKYILSQKIFNPGYIEKINTGFKNSRLFYSRQLWSLIIFQIWYKQYIEKENGKNLIN